MSGDPFVDDPTHGHKSLKEFRKSMPGMSAEQAEAVWEYFRGPALPDEAADPISEALRRLVRVSGGADELKNRVIQAYGEGMLNRAWHLAAETRGVDWLTNSRGIEGSVNSDTGMNLHLRDYLNLSIHSPSSLVLLCGCVVLLLVLLFPPFVIPLSGGISTNAGFAFLFAPPRMGNLVAVVNVALLSLEAIVVMLVTVAVFFVALVTERAIASRRQ